MDLSGTQSIHIQISEYHLPHLQRALDNLPERIRVQVITRAMRSLRQTTLSRLTQRASERVKISKRMVRERTTLTFNAGGNTQDTVIKSGWIHLYKLGARQTASGVDVKMRGSYRHAFLAEMDSGHRGVFRRVPGTRMKKRDSERKEQIRELFGPNPASDVVSNPEVYQQMLAQVIEEALLGRVASQIERILPG